MHTGRPVPLVAWMLAFSVADGQGVPGPDPLFESDSLLKLEIAAPIETITRDRSIEDYMPGKLSYKTELGEVVELDVGIKTRGRFRSKPDTCSFPPLRLNFKKSEMAGTLFVNQDKLKLVTHCETGSYVLEQAVLTEYLAYRVLNLLTEKSFLVRLVQIEYTDTMSAESFAGFGILIEHKNRLGARINASPISIEKTTASALDPEHLNLTSVFQYFIGNTDFSPIAGSPGRQCCHNYSLFGRGEVPVYSIPYDFDMAGFVSAPYAYPNPKLRLDSVRDRLYRGRCINNDRLPHTFDVFQRAREDIEALVREQDGLSRKTRSDTLRFIKGFYKDIAKPKSIERNFIRTCE